MKRLLIVIVLAAVACGGKPQKNAQGTKTDSEVRTIDSAALRPAPIEAPPMLTVDAAPPKVDASVASVDAPPPPTPQDEAVRSALPFAPAIGLDPVDGSKISIRANTPTMQYKNRLYYFSSEENKRAFAAKPEQYAKGPFSHL